VEFAYITGWRMKFEVLPLEWRQVDFKAGTVRLEPGTTKNKEGRTFPMTKALRALLDAEHAEHERLKKRGRVVPWVFFRMVANGRGGPLRPMPIKSLGKAFKTACTKAGVPGRIPHDFRRTAVRNIERAGVPRSVADEAEEERLTWSTTRYSGFLTSSGFRPRYWWSWPRTRRTTTARSGRRSPTANVGISSGPTTN
jgi:integrase